MTRALMVFLVICVLLYHVCPSQEFEMDNIGRVVRGHLGTLYDLRSKLTSTSNMPTSSPVVASPSTRKENPGYFFHYSPSDISHPLYSPTYNSQDFHSRMGKVADTSTSKWKKSEKSWDKYSKLSYKSSLHPTKNPNVVNSFNIHQTVQKNETQADSNPTTSTTTITTTGALIHTTSTTPTTQKPSLDLISIQQVLGQGLNSAMTAVLTQKLMNLIDQEVPEGILDPLKHLVSSGNRMVEFWDKKTSARDGTTPGIVEIMGYGLDQLKKFRDGQAIKSSDPVANITSASQTLIQGMITVKKLTNRVLGYDTDDEAAIESRGGYGHDSYGHGGGYGHHVSYGGIGGLDPFSLLAALAFGAFLLQLLLTLLNTSARSLDVVDLNTPLMMSDFHVPNLMNKMDKIFGTPMSRNKRNAGGENNMFYSVVDKLDGMYNTYTHIAEKPVCARLYMCRLAAQDQNVDENSLLSQLYMYGLGHLTKDKSATDFVKSIKERVAKGEDIDCNKIVTDCDQHQHHQ